MTVYGSWDQDISIDGETFHADLIDEKYARKAGFSRIFAIKGLPACFEKSLIVSSQICDVPHTWRIKECHSADEVTPDVLVQGKAVLSLDRKELHAHIITYVGEIRGQPNNFEFLAAGAVRDKLTRDYENEEYPVVSRLIVAPIHRGKGLGSLIMEHCMKALLYPYFGKKPKAIHFGTESHKILHAAGKVEKDTGINCVYVGDESYTASDGTHNVHDYLCFSPWFREDLLKACDRLSLYTDTPHALRQFREKLNIFTKKGVKEVSGASLETLFRSMVASLGNRANEKEAQNSVNLLSELFLIRNKIGACDPSTAATKAPAPKYSK